MDFLVPNYEKEGKAQFIVAVGCTGGMHRSVAMAEALYSHLLEKRLSCHSGTSDMMKNNVEEDFNPHQADLGIKRGLYVTKTLVPVVNPGP